MLFMTPKCLRRGTQLLVQNSSLMSHLMYKGLLLETWTSSVTLKTPDVTKLSWNSGPSVETQQQLYNYIETDAFIDCISPV